MMTRGVLGVALAGALAATTAAGQQPGDAEAGKVMDDLDRRIGEYERLRAAPGGDLGARTVFEFLDEDQDGVISRTEWNLRKMRIFTARDRNADRKLSPEDLPALGAEAFAAADTNGDGFIDGLEFNQAPFMQFDTVRTTEGPMDFAEFHKFMQRLSK